MADIDKNITPGFNDEAATTRPDAMSEAEYQQAFAKMAADFFTGRDAGAPPKLLYVTGLPGAGKSTYVAGVKEEDPRIGARLHINFDDLRVYHPRYATHIAADPVNAAARTDTAVERLIGWLTEEAAKRCYDVLLDDAAMRRDITRAILAPFKDAGYEIEAVVIAVPSVIARQAVGLRFEENFAAAKAGAPVAPRWVNTTEQDNAPAALVETAETLEDEGLAGKITVVDRAGRTLYTGGGEAGGKEAAVGRTVKAEMTRELTGSERADYQAKADRIAGLVTRRSSETTSPPATGAKVPGHLGR